jgi:hypothetical protein
MLTDPSRMRLLARFLFSTLANRLRELFGDLIVRLLRGRRLNSGQRLFLLGFPAGTGERCRGRRNHALSDDEGGAILTSTRSSSGRHWSPRSTSSAAMVAWLPESGGLVTLIFSKDSGGPFTGL